jgi:PAS domain S-box-containing protein
MRDTLRKGIIWSASIAAVTIGTLILSAFSLSNGFYSVFPYFLLLPVLLVVYVRPHLGVVYSVILGWIYLVLVYYFVPGDLSVFAASTAWFYILVSVGVVITSFASGQKREEQKYRAIFESSQAGLFTFDNTILKITGANKQCSSLFGYEANELNGKTLSLLIPDNVDLKFFLDEIRRRHRVENLELRFLTKQGDLKWVLVSAAIADETTITCSAIDLSDRKKAEDTLKRFNEELEKGIVARTRELNAALAEKDVLLREVHHRVKNNLQIISSLLNLQSSRVSDEKVRNAIRDSQSRVKAMAIVHQKMYQSEGIGKIDLCGYVRYMIMQLFSAYEVDIQTINPVIDIRDVMIDIDTAIPLGLVINELVTNSLKYAFPEGREGTITINASRSEGIISLTVADDGIGMPDEFDWRSTDSLGLRIVTTLVKQLDGEIERTGQKGTVFTVTFRQKPDKQQQIHGTFNPVPE